LLADPGSVRGGSDSRGIDETKAEKQYERSHAFQPSDPHAPLAPMDLLLTPAGGFDTVPRNRTSS